MVQLHFTEDTIRQTLRNAREELRDYYWLLEEFYLDLRSDPRVTSVSTIECLLDKARNFLRWLKNNSIRPENIDYICLRRFIAHLRIDRRVSDETLRVYIRMLRRLMRILNKHDLAKQLKYPRYTVKHMDLPSPELIEKIIEEQKRLRTQVILALLYETAARLSEILSLKGKHVIETPQGYYRIVIEEPKNGEFRIVYVIKYAGLLRQYLNIRKPKPEEYLFPSPVYRDKPIHPKNIEKLFNKLSKKYGVKLHPHMLRHLRATLYVKEGLQERIIMKLLGHKTEKMMRIYVNLVHKDVEEAVLKHYGLNAEEATTINAIKCPRCGADNREDANYCWRCAYPLHQQAALELELREKDIEEKLKKLLEIIKKHPEILKEL